MTRAMPVSVETRGAPATVDLADHFDWDDHTNPHRGRVFNLMRRALKPILRHTQRAIDRRRFGSHWRIDEDFVFEKHHRAYGAPWCIGREQFNYFLQRGLDRSHRVADLGCGSLRFGIWAIGYLDADCYFGIDAHRKSLEAAASYEIPLHGLEEKRPRLLLDSDFSLDHFGVTFDWVVVLSLLVHLAPEERRRALAKITRALAPEGRLVVNHGPPLSARELIEQYGLMVVHQADYPCRFLPGGTGWIELMKVPAGGARPTHQSRGTAY